MTTLGAVIRRDIPPAKVIEHVRSVQAGFEELWIIEDLPFAGGISQLAAVLAATDSVAVGHGIAPAPFRNPAALAMEWATLAEIFPGRVIGGLGHGVQEWMGQIGDRVNSPLTLLEETIVAVRRLLAGELVDMAGRYVQLDGVRLEYSPRQVPMVLAGVRGPKSLQLSGAVADGTVLPEGWGPDDILKARRHIEEGRTMVGRTDHHHITVFAGFYAGPMAGIAGDNPDAAVEYDWDAVSEDVDEVTAKLQTLIDAGVDSIALLPFGQDVTEQLQLAASQIVPQLARN